jgi:predicted transcriptional regulator
MRDRRIQCIFIMGQPVRLSLLQTLAAVLDSGSTQGAARVLGLSQSAVSRRIGQLEPSSAYRSSS